MRKSKRRPDRRPSQWRVEIYKGPCLHRKKKERMLDTAFCPECKASRGFDRQWRVLIEGDE